jgi:hypothetical protein
LALGANIINILNVCILVLSWAIAAQNFVDNNETFGCKNGELICEQKFLIGLAPLFNLIKT